MLDTPASVQFNAARDPWIPVQRGNTVERVSLSEALNDAHWIDGLSLGQPLAAAALLRVLVALTIRSQGLHSPDDARRLWVAGRVDPQRTEDYLTEIFDRFEVFHPEHPFLQVGGLRPTSGKPKGASGLLLHVASGNNVPLFSPLTEGDDVTLEVADALVHLVTVLGWDTAAIKTGAMDDPAVKGGKTMGNPTGPLGQLGVVQLLGRNLFETLILNTPLLPPALVDAPAWERSWTPEWETRQPLGVLDLLTWPSRRARLIPSEGGEGVSAAIVAAGDRLATPVPHLEPHTRWRPTKNDVVAQRPVRWQPGSSAWRGLDGLLTLDAEESVDAGGITTAAVIRQLPGLRSLVGEDYPLNVLCVGVKYGNQSAVIDDVFVDSVPLPLAAMRSDSFEVRDALMMVSAAAEAVRRAINDLADNLRRLEGGDKLPWDKGVHPGNDAMADLTLPTIRLLRGLQSEPDRFDEGLLAWQIAANRIAWAAAQPLLDAASPQAFAGRELPSGTKTKLVRLADCEGWFGAAIRKALPDLPTRQQPERSAT